jgi:hypothetical protein
MTKAEPGSLEWRRDSIAEEIERFFDRFNFCKSICNGAVTEKEQAKNREKGRMKMTCCCYNCAVSKGHFSHTPYGKERDEEVDKLKEAHGWSDVTGFLKIGEGCMLPRNMRSIICQGYLCYEWRDKLLNTLRLKRFKEIAVDAIIGGHFTPFNKMISDYKEVKIKLGEIC